MKSNNENGRYSNHNNRLSSTQTFFTDNKKGHTENKSDKPNYPCAFCKGKHFNDQCNICASLEDRQNKIKECHLCSRCSGNNHESRECQFKKACFYCHRDRNRALCKQRCTPKNQLASEVKIKKLTFDPSVRSIISKNMNQQKVAFVADVSENVKTDDEKENVVESLTCQIDSKHNFVHESKAISLLLAKCIVINSGNPEMSVKANIFFDSGSQKSYITNELQKELNLKGEN